MRKLTVTCNECHSEMTLIVDEDAVFVPVAFASHKRAVKRAVESERVAPRAKRKWTAPQKPLPCRKCGRVFFYGGARHQHERNCKATPKKRGE